MSALVRVLIASRGEIAVRIIRAARDLGIETVAVYSQADAQARHVNLADYSVLVGPSPAAQSYLRREALVHVAKATGCDAVHPGYGFLAEDAEFASQVEGAGLIWVGPAAKTIARMGDKAEARRIAAAADVPTVPGSAGVLVEVDDFIEFGHQYGYPLLLKASAGGGGKGMRIVRDENELVSVLPLAQQEAGGAFGDDSIYVERYLPRVRHVEVQVLGDVDGRIVALGERDCSLQRRHQKIVEEGPAPNLPPQTRAELSHAAIRLSESMDYVGAGTVEFLVDVDTGSFYFIEMNTRIQVEHPITEEITNTDLVTWQLRIAAGDRLSHLEFVVTGHAIELRITAEDPTQDFIPTPGQLTTFEVPGGPGVRCDTHCFPGSDVPPYYDSLLAKLVIRGHDRDQVLRRARRALREFNVEGVATTIPLHQWVLDQPEFINATHTTGYLVDFSANVL